MILTYLKWGGLLALVVAAAGVGYHFGGMGPKTQLAAFQAAQAENTTKAVLAERASAAHQAAVDINAETQHAKDLADIAALAPVSAPLLVYRTVPAPGGAVHGAQSAAGSLPAHPAEGGSEPVGGAVDIRPDIEALKKRLEAVMADYRELAAEWPKQ